MTVAGQVVLRAVGERAVARVAAAGLQAVTLMVISYALLPAQAGDLFLGFSTTAVCTGLLVGGMNSVSLRAAAYDGLPAMGADAATWGSRLALIGSALPCLVSSALGTLTWLFIAGAVWAYSEVVAEIVFAEWSGQRRFRIGHVFLLCRRGFLAVILVVESALAPEAVPGTVLAYAAALSAGMLARTAFRRSVSRLCDIWAHSRPFWFVGAGAQIMMLDVLVLRASFGSEVAGGYALVTRLAMPLAAIAASLVSVLVPFMVAEARGRLLRSSYLVAVIGSIAVATSAYMLSGPIVGLLLGPGYREYAPFFIAAAVAAGISGIAQVTLSDLTARGRGAVAGLVIAGGNCSGLVMMVGLGRVSTVDGIALGVVVAQLVVLFGLLLGARAKEVPTSA